MKFGPYNKNIEDTQKAEENKIMWRDKTLEPNSDMVQMFINKGFNIYNMLRIQTEEKRQYAKQIGIIRIEMERKEN